MSINEVLINKEKIIETLRMHKKEFMYVFGVKQIGLFGSYTTGTQRPDSDIDILVDFKDNYETFDNYMDLKFYLEERLDKKVDLVIKRSVKDMIKERVYRETIYA